MIADTPSDLNISKNSDRGVVTAFENVQWMDPEIHPPPRGCDLQIFTAGGIAIRGVWHDDPFYLAWAPFLKKPPWLAEKQTKFYHSQSRI